MIGMNEPSSSSSKSIRGSNVYTRSSSSSSLIVLLSTFILFACYSSNCFFVNGTHYIVEWNNPVISNLTISVGDTVTWITSDMEMNTVTLIERIPIYLDEDNQVTFENPKLKLQQQQQQQSYHNTNLLKEKEKEKDQKYSYSFDSPISFNNPKYHYQQQQQQQQLNNQDNSAQQSNNNLNPSSSSSSSSSSLPNSQSSNSYSNTNDSPTRRRYSFTFTQEGLYLYSSKYNPDTMQGTVQVLPIIYDPDANSSSKQSLWSLCFAFFIGLLMFFVFN